MAERSVVMSRPAAGKSDKAGACRREQYARARISAREKSLKGQCLPSGGIIAESYPVLQSVLSKNTNPVSGDRRLFSEYATRNSKICDCNTSKRGLTFVSRQMRNRPQVFSLKLNQREINHKRTLIYFFWNLTKEDV